MLDLATQTGNKYYQSQAHITMGQSIFFEGNREKGIQNVIEAIDLMANTDSENTDPLIHSYLNLLASLYSEMKDYDNALKTNERNLQLTMEGTRWGCAQNQQQIDRRMALAKMASVLARMGRSSSGNLQSKYFQQAYSTYAAWQAVQYEGNHTRMTVDAVGVGIVALPQFEVGHILQAQFLARPIGAQNEVLELCDVLLATRIAQGILEGAGGVLANGADARLHVLLLQQGGDVVEPVGAIFAIGFVLMMVLDVVMG